MSDKDLDVFSPEAPSTPAALEDKDYLTELVGEGKPYKDAASLAKAVVFKEDHIKRLEAEQAIAREELAKRVTVEEFMDQLKSQQQAPAAPVQPEPTAPNPQKGPASDPAEVEKLVDSRLTALRDQERRAHNAKFVKQELAKKFGGTYETVLRNRTKELGLTEDFANTMAQTQPEAFLAMIGAPAPKGPDIAPPAGSRIPPQVAQGKGWQYYENLRKKDPVAYLSPRNLLEMDRELARQGTSFYEH